MMEKIKFLKDVIVDGDFTVTGTSIIENVEQVLTKGAVTVINAENNDLELTLMGTVIRTGKVDGAGQYIDYAILYDPITEAIKLGTGLYNSETNMFTFAEGEGKPLTTRDLSTDNKIVKWDNEKLTLVESCITAQDNGGIVINEGVASGDNSIAGGTTDIELIKEILGEGYKNLIDRYGNNIASWSDTILGYILSAIDTDLTVSELRQLLTISPSTAEGMLSIALGASNKSSAAGSISLGFCNTSGAKGYYISNVDTTNNSITLSTKQGSAVAPTTNPAWAKNDILFITNGKRYFLTIKEFDASTNTVKLEETLPFSSLEDLNTQKIPPIIGTTYDLTPPNERSVVNISKPTNGEVALGWGAFAFGSQNVVTGSNAYGVGYKNIAAGDFSTAFGQENTAGYTAFATGIQTSALSTGSVSEGYKTTASGEYAHAAGIGTTAIGTATHTEGYATIADGTYAHAEGYKTKANAHGAHAEGSCFNAPDEGQASELPIRQVTIGKDVINIEGPVAYGRGSHAEGVQTIASYAAHAEGLQTNATANASHAEGEETSAINSASHAEGIRTSARSKAAHAEGIDTDAVGQAAHAEGVNTATGGYASHAEGNETKANGYISHAEGNKTEATGAASHAEGDATKASGDNGAHAEGYKTTASGTASHAEGRDTVASVGYSHAEGKGSEATGQCAHAEGDGTKAGGNAAHAEGKYTRTDSEGAHAEGSYVADADKNPVTRTTKYYKSNSAGVDINIEGGSYAGNRGSHAEGIRTFAGHDAAHAEGYDTDAVGQAAHAEGYQTVAKGEYSHAEGKSTKATGTAAHAEGGNTRASNAYAHAEGSNTRAQSEASHAEGQYAVADSGGAHAEGSYIADEDNNPVSRTTKYYKNLASGIDVLVGGGSLAYNKGSHAEGIRTFAGHEAAHSEGIDTDAVGEASHAEGKHTVAKGSGSHAEGTNSNSIGNYSHAEGQESTASNIAAHAEGHNTKASGGASHAEGTNTHAEGNYSHTEGGYTHAAGQYSHAEGSGTYADAHGAHAEGTSIATSSENNVELSRGFVISESKTITVKGPVAWGRGSHAEGANTVAKGYASHAEGRQCDALDDYSHAEGFNVEAAGIAHHAQGRYNIVNPNVTPNNPYGTYAHIVGNGSSGGRSNAHTLDWNGNAWYAGNITAENNLIAKGLFLNGKSIEQIIAEKVQEYINQLPTPPAAEEVEF